MTAQEKSDFSLNNFFVYVLFSLKDKKLYIGYSTNLELRLIEHNSGKDITLSDWKGRSKTD